jgi:hypothetical protein
LAASPRATADVGAHPRQKVAAVVPWDGLHADSDLNRLRAAH